MDGVIVIAVISQSDPYLRRWGVPPLSWCLWDLSLDYTVAVSSSVNGRFWDSWLVPQSDQRCDIRHCLKTAPSSSVSEDWTCDRHCHMPQWISTHPWWDPVFSMVRAPPFLLLDDASANLAASRRPWATSQTSFCCFACCLSLICEWEGWRLDDGVFVVWFFSVAEVVGASFVSLFCGCLWRSVPVPRL